MNIRKQIIKAMNTKRDRNIKHFIFNDIDVLAKGKFRESHTLGFDIYSLTTKEFLFTVRQKNNKERLDKGYWFIGNNNYLITSFWSGKDWKNKTPYISLVFLPKHSSDRRDGREDCFIELTSKSSSEITSFMKNIMNRIDGFKKRTDGCWFLPINQNGYIDSLEYFIEIYKPVIDECIREYKPTDIEFLEQDYTKYIDRIVDRKN